MDNVRESAEVAATQKIVIGVDSSAESAAALEWALGVFGDDAQLVAVRAWDVPLMVSSYVPEAIFPRDFERLAEEALAQSCSEITDDRLRLAVRRGKPGAVIVAESADADLTVVGHRGDGRVSMLLGSTADFVLHHSNTPVVVVRGDETPSCERVVVGVDAPGAVDGSTSADRSVEALRWAYGLPGVRHVTVVHSWFLPPLEFGSFLRVPLDLTEWDAAAEDVIDRVVEAAGAPPPNVVIDRKVMRANAIDALVGLSEDTDLVVVGSRGRGGFVGLLLGSTSEAVAARSACPVAVIR